jgi:hypothetical protein
MDKNRASVTMITPPEALSLKVVLLSIKTTDIVSGGAWGRRPHTLNQHCW